MLPVFLTVCSVFFGSSAGEGVCHGDRFKLPFVYTPPLYDGPLYFTPSNGGPRKVVMDNGEVNDPRFTLKTYSLYLNNVTERDDGYFSPDGKIKIATLKYLDCAENISRQYGYEWTKKIPSEADFLEYTSLNSSDHPKIVWNRTDPQIIVGQKGRVIINAFEILYVTQEDSGYYSFRKKDNTIVYRGRLVVQEEIRHYEPEEDSRLMIEYPRPDRKWTVTFTPKGEMKQTLTIAGRLVVRETWFTYRVQDTYHGIEINPVRNTDSGTFEFRDPQGNLALVAVVEVYYELSDALQYLVIFAMMVLGWILYCCWYSCKRSCKKDKSAPQPEATSAVYNHGDHKPTGQSYSAVPPPSTFSHQPKNSFYPTASSCEPPVYHPVNVHVSVTVSTHVDANSSQPEVEVKAGPIPAPGPSVGSDVLSSDSEPRFELKGLTLSSASPLSLNSTSCDVYTSDKLNLL